MKRFLLRLWARLTGRVVSSDFVGVTLDLQTVPGRVYPFNSATLLGPEPTGRDRVIMLNRAAEVEAFFAPISLEDEE